MKLLRMLITPLLMVSALANGADTLAPKAELKQFIEVQYIDLTKIEKISRFRSCVGHNYGDAEEGNVSKKHYFAPLTPAAGETWKDQIAIRSPVQGVVVDAYDEGNRGTRVEISIDKSYYGINIPNELRMIIFHVQGFPLGEGAFVAEGMPLGTHVWIEDDEQTYSDIDINYGYGEKRFSYIDLMLDEAIYENYGRYFEAGTSAAEIREALQISQTERAGPCESFSDEGNESDWVYLTAP